MKIALIHSRLNHKGGSQRQAIHHALGLARRGHDVTLYTLAPLGEDFFPELLQLPVVSLPGYRQKDQRKTHVWLGFLNYIVYSRRESRAARTLAAMIPSDTDILYAEDRLAFRIAVFAKKRLRIPSVLMMNDISTKTWVWWRKAMFDHALALPLKTRIFYRLIDWHDVRKFIKPHDAITVLDERTKKWTRTWLKKESVVVRSGLDLDHFPYREHKPPEKKHIDLFAAGIFFIHRRYEDIIRALGLLRDKGYDARLTIVGNYSSREYQEYVELLRRLVEELSLEGHVSFPGRISDEELIRHYRAHNIYISANHLQSWGLAAFEAMSSGMPVIVSRTAGAAEVLTDRKNAMLINAKAPEEIAAAVKELVDHPDLYQKLSREGRAFVEKFITWDRTAEELEKIFQKLLEKYSSY